MSEGLDRLTRLVNAEPKMTVKKVAELVQTANIQVGDVEPFADYDHPIADGYGRKMAVETDHFEIMVMSWNSGDFSSIHDHGYTEWGAVQVFGNVMHHSFSNQGSEFKLSKKEILTTGSIAKVNHPLIHQMGNVTSEPYVTLHIYGSNDHAGVVTADARIFELETGLIKHTTGGAFFNLPDDQVYDITSMKPVERQTFVHQAALLLQYYERYDNAVIAEKRTNLLQRLEAIEEKVEF